jgi:hypothetical protein
MLGWVNLKILTEDEIKIGDTFKKQYYFTMLGEIAKLLVPELKYLFYI